MNHDPLFENQAVDAEREGYDTFRSDHAAYVAHSLHFFDLLEKPSAIGNMTIEQFHDCPRGEEAKRYVAWAHRHGGSCLGPTRNTTNFEANRTLAQYISEAVEANPELGFGEILVRLGIVDENRSTNWENERGRDSWYVLRRVERLKPLNELVITVG